MSLCWISGSGCVNPKLGPHYPSSAPLRLYQHPCNRSWLICDHLQVHTRDINTAIRVSNELRAGTVWVNNYNQLHHSLPFGGYKESGIGRELGEEALANYTQTKTVNIRLAGALF